MTTPVTALETLLAAATQADPAAQALWSSDPARVERLQQHLASAFPAEPEEALQFTQRLCSLQSLVMKRHAHDLREGPLTPADRIVLAQQEVDLTVLAHLATAVYEARTERDFVRDAQEAPMPLQLADRVHPGDLEREAPWAANESRGMELHALTRALIAAWQEGDFGETALAKRHSSLPAVLQMLVTQGLIPAIESGAYGADLADHLAAGSEALWDALGDAVCAGYCLAIAHGALRGDLRETANRMLDPAEVITRLLERAEGPTFVPVNPLDAALFQVLVAELVHGGGESTADTPEPNAGLDAALEPLLARALGWGFCAAAEEERSASPLPPGR